MRIGKFFILSFMLMAGVPQQGNAQFLKKLNKALEKVDKTLTEVNKALGVETEQTNSETTQEKAVNTANTVSTKVASTPAVQAVKANTSAPQTYTIPEKLVVITKQNVNIRKEPNANGEVLLSSPAGNLFELVSESDGWYGIKAPGQTDTMFVSSTVSTLVPGASVPRTDKNIVQNPNTDIVFQNVVNTNQYYTNTSYQFTKGENSGEVLCYYSYTGAYADGRIIPASEKYYKGLRWVGILS